VFKSSMIFAKVSPSQCVENDFNIGFIWVSLKLTKQTLNNAEEVDSDLIFKKSTTALEAI